MKFINEIIEIFKNITLENIIDFGIGLAIIVIFKILSSPFAYIIVKMFKFKEKNKNKIKSSSFYKPLKTFFVLLGIYMAAIALKLPENIFDIVTKIFKICTILLTAKGFANLFDTSSDTFSKFREKVHFDGTDATVNFFSKIIKAIIYIIAGFIVISELGYDLSGLATGLGIGSVVIALAAQDIAKSFIAGLSMISDRPFNIGDFIQVDKYEGTVEDITFRTTRIRTIENQVVILPNSVLVSSNIVNATAKGYLLTLTLEANTPLEKIANLIEDIKQNLNDNPQIIKDTIRVYFNTVSESGIDITINFRTEITDFVEFLKVKEGVNYTILDMIQNAGIELAYPSQSIYLKKE